jgi:Flp pilus assembly protein TadB
MRSTFGTRLLALAAVLVTLLLGVPAQVAAQEQPAVTTKVLPSEAGTVRLVVSARSLPPGASLDPGSVRVTGGGMDWQATAEPKSASAGTVKRTAVLVVDTSGSMGERGIAAARTAAISFLDATPPDVAVGLVTFASEARLVVPPTKDRAALRGPLQQMRSGGNTSLYDGITVGLAALGSDGDRAMVVLSESKDNASRTALPAVTAALDASGASIDIAAIGKGDGQGPVLQQLAAAGSGEVVQVSNGDQITDVFTGVARTFVNEVTVTAVVPPEVTGNVSDLTVEVDAGESTVVAAATVALPAAGPNLTGTVATVPSVVAPSSVPWLLPAVLVVAFLGLFLLFGVGLAPQTYRKDSSAKRARDIERYTLSPGSPATKEQEGPTAITEAALAWAGRTVQRRGVEDSWRSELDRAAIPLRPQEWFIVRLGVALAGAALAVLFLPWWLLTAPLLALLFWLIAGVYVKVKAKRRLKRFADQLPDVLQLIAGSLRSGFSLPQAIDNAAKDGEQPIAGELSRALAESRLGVDLEDALDRVAERMRSTDLSWTVMAIRIAREVGGNLAEVLLSTAETMRERGRIQRQVRVLSAEGRLSAYVLLGLPAGITLFMIAFRGSYIAPLVTDPLGWLMTGYGLLSVTLGAWVMSRMCKLEV